MTPDPRFWRGRRVLLTGHTGFKGSWTALWLQALGARLHGLALPPDGGEDDSFWAGLGRPAGEGRFADVRDAAAVLATVQAAEPEVVIHMAAQALVPAGHADPAGTFATNVMGTVNVLEAARATPSVRAVVVITSDKCYDNREQIWAYRETDALGGADPYSASKGCAELVAGAYRRSFFADPAGAQLATVRAGNVVGGGDRAADRLVPDCVRAFAIGRPVLIRNPLATRPWQHVLEPVAGYLLLAQALVEQGAAAAEAWNLGPADEDAWPVERVVERVAARWGDGAQWRPDLAARPREAMLLRVDATKARLRLGWRPRLTVGEALDWSVDWYRGVKGGASVRALTERQLADYVAREPA